jgi:hypothetical protein
MQILLAVLIGIAGLGAINASAAQDKCAPLINDGPKYQTCRMNEVAANAQERGKRTREGTRDDPAIGLTYQEVVDLFNKGKPLACNSTKTMYGEHLQCWYPDRAAHNRPPTMYFDNRKLTATQR